MLRNFSIIWRTFPGLQFSTSRITYMISLLSTAPLTSQGSVSVD
jgi:hypothetical protein